MIVASTTDIKHKTEKIRFTRESTVQKTQQDLNREFVKKLNDISISMLMLSIYVTSFVWNRNGNKTDD